VFFCWQTVFYRDRMFCGYKELAWVGRAFLTDVAGGTTDLWNLIDTYAEGDPQQLSIIHRLMGFSGQVAWVGFSSQFPKACGKGTELMFGTAAT
jgi:hypothetical protein